jgi:hypothetical protein
MENVGNTGAPRPIGLAYTVDELERDCYVGYFEQWLENRGFAKTTRQQYISAARTYLRYLRS